MFERFSARAQRVLVLAQDEARMLNDNFVGTEHILLGIIDEGECDGARALESMGISLETVRQQITEAIIGRVQQEPSENMPLTPGAKEALEVALRESTQHGLGYIGTDHILIGLMREGKGVAAQVLLKLGVGLSSMQLPHGREGDDPPPRGEPSQIQVQASGPAGHAVSERSILSALTEIGERLAAIERRLGLPE
jgi:ATP-dependent Clp protease ATP-binding subunit ClpC